jgi:hypothetical protein
VFTIDPFTGTGTQMGTLTSAIKEGSPSTQQ